MNIIVTGASSGIGFEAVVRMSAQPGNKIVAIARNREKLLTLVDTCNKNTKGAQVFSMVFDLENDAYETLITQINQHFEYVDILINNAGALVLKPFEQLNDTDWQKMFSVNVLAPVRLIRLLLPYMGQTSRSHIINIGSMGGYQGTQKFPGLSAYSSSKGMLAILSECLAEELKDRNIAVNCLALGSAQTEMLKQAFPGYEAPLTAAEMAAFIVDFSLSAHQCINGKVLPISKSTP